MNIIFFCQSLDSSDPVVGDTLDRVLAISRQSEIGKLYVISSKGEVVEAFNKVEHLSLGRQDSSRIVSFFRLIGIIIKIHKKNKIDWVYLYMTPTRAFIFAIVKFIFNFKIATWFAHTQFTRWTKFNLKYCTDIWFSVDKAQTFPCHHLKIIGQGVDLEKFKPCLVTKKWDFVTIGRITPVKRLELILESIAHLKKAGKISASLVVCGDSYSAEDIDYKKSLIKLTETLKIENQVEFLGTVKRDELPNIINKSRFFIFAVPGGIGKATLEAMGVGLPMIIAYPQAIGFFPEYLGKYFISLPTKEAISEKMRSYYLLDKSSYDELSTKLRKFTEDNFSLDVFAKKIVHELKSQS